MYKLQLGESSSPSLISTKMYHPQPAVRPLPPRYLWLVYYRAPRGVSTHWALHVTGSSDSNYGTFYQVREHSQEGRSRKLNCWLQLVTGNDRFTQNFVLDVGRIGDYTHRTSTLQAAGRLFLGDITYQTEHGLAPYGEEALRQVTDLNSRRYGSANCQTWVEMIVDSYERDKLVPIGTLASIRAQVPKTGA